MKGECVLIINWFDGFCSLRIENKVFCQSTCKLNSGSSIKNIVLLKRALYPIKLNTCFYPADK